MATLSTDPELVEEARATVGARFDELRRRFHEVKLKYDVRAYIQANPWRAVAIGALAGVVVAGLRGRKRTPPVEARRGIADAALAGVSALAMTLVRELAASQLMRLVQRWQQPNDEPATPYAR